MIPGRPCPAPRMTGKEIAMATRGYGRNAARIRRYHEWRDAARMAAMVARVRQIEGPVSVTAEVYVSGRRGDADNYLKAVLDAFNGLAWADDRQVVDARVRMWQAKGKDERTEVEVVAAEEAAS